MKPFNKEEFSRLCAEFLNFKYKNHKKAWGRYPLDDNSFLALKGWISMFHLKFDSDWNWIMEVVEKIESLGYWVEICGANKGKPDNLEPIKWCEIHKDRIHNQDTGTYFVELSSGIIPIFRNESKTKKEAVVQAIWEFLNFYYEK